MFFGTGFLVLLLLTGYAYIRIRSLLETRRQKILFTVAYLLLVFSLPLLAFVSRTQANVWGSRFLMLGYLSLPYLLYLFLAVLASDILRGLNRLLRLLPPERLRTRRTRLIILGVLLLVPVVVVVAGNIRNTALRVNEYRIEIPRRSSPERGLAIAVASDFHLGELTDADMMRRFADRINALDADLLLLPGDLLEGHDGDGDVDGFAREFHRISTRYGLFASLGNHESHWREDKLPFFRKSGITVLQDSMVRIGGACWLMGRKDSRVQGRKPIGELMHAIADSLPVVVLDHKPTDLDSISASGADIAVCGHTHHGQLWPLNYVTESVYDLSWGYRKLGSLHVFVTSGVQVWGPPVRTAGDSEIMLIHVVLR